MEHSVLGYVLYVSMWFNTKFVRVPDFLIIDLTVHSKAFEHCLEAFLRALPATHIWLNTGGGGRLDKNNF